MLARGPVCQSGGPSPPREGDAGVGGRFAFPLDVRSGGLLAVAVVLIMLITSFPGASAGGAGNSGVLPPREAPGSLGSTAASLQLSEAQASLHSFGTPSLANHTVCPGSRMVTAQCTPHRSPPKTSGVPAGWTNLFGAHGPFTTNYATMMAYDSRDGYPLLMESTNASGGSYVPAPAAFFRYVNGLWQYLPEASGPMYCYGSGLGTDSTDGVIVYVGGLNCPMSNTTWTFQGGSWMNRTTSPQPPARDSPALSDDPPDGYMLLFGGAPDTSGSHFRNDTWSFSNGTWTNRTNWSHPTPSPRARAAGAFDSTDGSVLLLGGCNSTAFYPCGNDTWRYTAGSWSRVNTSGPRLPYGQVFAAGAIADDPIDHYVVDVFATIPSSGGIPFPWVWTFSGGNWTPLNFSGLPPMGPDPLLAFSSSLSSLLYAPSYNFGQNGPLPTWLYRGGGWSNGTASVPWGRAGATMTYDAADGYSVMFGGSEPTRFSTRAVNETWRFASGAWSPVTVNRTPPARSDAGLVYDASDGYTLLFGGAGASGGLNDTWEYTNGGWSPLTPTSVPPVWSTGSSMVYDGTDGYVLLLGAYPTVTSWAYHGGVWSNLTARGAVSPARPPANPIVYDSADAFVLLFGTTLPSGYPTQDTWIFKSGNWTNVTSRVSASPPPRAASAAVDDPAEGYVLLFGGAAGMGGGSPYLNDTWTFFNFTWTRQFTPVPPDPRADVSVAFDGAGRRVILFGGSTLPSYVALSAACPTGDCFDTWFWVSGALTSPVIHSFGAVPATTDPGISVAFIVAAVGGTPPYSYSYSGLPAGCPSRNVSSLTCTPTVTGNYLVTVRVTDIHGNATNSTTRLTVVRPPSVTAFVALPTSVTVGTRTLLSVQVSGGAGAVRYNYSHLPPGCSSQTVPTLPCTPFGSGTFSISVRVVDGLGQGANATLNLTVTPAGVSGGPQIAGFSLLPPTIVLGNQTAIAVNASGGSGYLSYVYSGLPPGCLGANASSLSCAPTSAGTFSITASVSDRSGTTAKLSRNLTVYPVGGGAGAMISGFSAAPSSFELGQATVLLVAASGGVGPLSYAYPTLPPGCASENVSSLPCTPSTAGSFPVYVVVTDSAGHTAGAVGRLNVSPMVPVSPSISLFLAAPSTVALGETTHLVVAARGGVLPYHYRFVGLPPGCTSASVNPLSCTPQAAGSYTVNVSVIDAAGLTANSTTLLTVTPASIPPGSRGPVLSPAWMVLFSTYGLIAVGGLIGAVVVAVVSSRILKQRRDRKEGEEIVRAWNREIEQADAAERRTS